MAVDIVERLRRCKENIGQPVWAFNHFAVRDTIETAAAAIEALRAELAEEKRTSEYVLNSYVDENQRISDKRDKMRALLVEAQRALRFFREWGDALNKVVGYNPPSSSWEPHMHALARIDAALAEKEGT